MAINIVHYTHNNIAYWGVLQGDAVLHLAIECETTGEFIKHYSAERLRTLTGELLDLKDITLLSPVTHKQQFICQGANYRQHMIESGIDPDIKAFNMIFTKASSCICPANSPVVCPSHVKLLDYEIELGLVIKQDIIEPLQIAPDNLLDYVAALVIVNDYSARDVQLPQMQFYKGKSYRTFGPVGPWLCLLETGDLTHLLNLDLTLTVDGEIRQQDSTQNLVFKPAETLSELSTVQTLHPGDLIATGTPAGCALRAPSPRMQRLMGLIPEKTKWRLFIQKQSQRPNYLKSGQVVESTIRSPGGEIDLGKQRNVVTSG